MFLLDITVPSVSVGHGVWGVGMTLSVECGAWISTQPLASARLVYWPPYWWVWLVGWSMDAGRYFWTSGSNRLVLSDLLGRTGMASAGPASVSYRSLKTCNKDL